MQDHYAINVAKDNGRKAYGGGRSYSHFFRAEVRDTVPAKEAAAAIRAAFPEPEYKVDVTLWQGRGYSQDF
ncbi:hypothetical protein BAJUN_01880 [Bajunvirus bajun]|uniref:Uncharacterized protein n=1 Tax=Brevundimonas phage vB_BgoS-Bajun TaxID=2948594 RepID=A0A9E7N6U8_9CAUD|nr:hypothetical protein BAJUN_01880 [Brevundimonas phage vB_BgoS-Bajun]